MSSWINRYAERYVKTDISAEWSLPIIKTEDLGEIFLGNISFPLTCERPWFHFILFGVGLV